MTSLKELKTKNEKLTKAATIDFIVYVASIIASIEPISVPTAILLMYLAYKQGKTLLDIVNCNEYKTLNRAYEDIIGDFIKLREKLEMKDPLETFELYNYLMRHDMLSLTEESIVYKIPYSEPIQGALALNNHGDVLNIQKALLDICSKTELDAKYLCGLKNGLEVTVKHTITTPTAEELQEIMADLSEEDRKKLGEIGDEATKNDVTFEFSEHKPSLSEKKYGNTSIIQINDSNYSYFVDPGHSTVYELTQDGKLQSNRGEELIIKPKGSKVLNRNNKLKVLDVKQTKPLSEIIPCLIAIDKKLVANKDILATFEKDINEKLITAEKAYHLILR